MRPGRIRHTLNSVAYWARPSLLPAAIAAIVIVGAGYAYEAQNDRLHRNELHARGDTALGLIGSRLEGEINRNVTALQGLANMFAAAPDQAAAQFPVLARKLLAQNNQFHRVAAAPNGVVAQTFPVGGNERYNGSDLNRFVASDARRAFGQLAMTGPMQLSDGSRGFDLLIPVISSGAGPTAWWGYVEGVIDERRLYIRAGLIDRPDARSELRKGAAGLNVSIRTIGSGSSQQPLFGNAAIFDGEAVRRTVSFPGGTWELAAVPAEGWETPLDNQRRIRLATAIAALVIIGPILLAGGLVGERQRHIAGLKARETLIRSLSQRLDLALEASKTGIWELSLSDRGREWDRQMYILHGLTEEQSPSEESWRATVHPEDIAAAEAAIAAAIADRTDYWSQYRVVLPDGSVRHIRSVGSRLTIGDDEKLTGISWDVTEDVLLNERLKSAKEQSDRQKDALFKITQRLDMALSAYQCGLWEADLDEGLTIWDARMCQLYGIPDTGERITHEAWLNAIHPDDRKDAEATAAESIATGTPYLRKARVVHPDGTVRYIQSVGKLHVEASGKRKFVGLAFDVTDDMLMTEQLKHAKAVADAKNLELEQAKDRIEHNSLHDPLTGLGNRRKLDGHLEGLAKRSRSKAVNIAILHIDLDRFKQINDTLGHAAGDALLVHVAQILRSSVDHNDLVARIGGDEFVVVIESDDHTHLSALSQRITGLMRQPVDYNGHMCRFGVSIGIAVASGTRIDTRKLLVNADIALYRAKGLGRNRHEFFTSVLEAEIVSNKRMADDILSGIENNEFIPYYQPQICARTLKLAGVEALIRWHHPQNGLLLPDRFLKVAEDLNVTATLDRIVLEKALIDCSRWAAKGILMPKISVNVSARRLRDETLVETLTGLSILPGQITFELVESIFLDESDDVVLRNIERIKELGIDIEIDDFGTGHTSIVSLLKLRPKRLKIDRQLVAPILTSRHEQALVRSIIDIGKSLGIEIVAEGVETMAHAEMLSALGCDLLQGFAFAAPLPGNKFQAYALGHRRKAAS
ncbi:diguanylate cyclase (GGDEF)-like protein/PAS domain S-box-containing protein [Mycoplana sp. BE70]|uniref:bifunctional diguanylate cyclase/phosphodiesterase n=1 Tax=Mycoplana sp. BE70 TaxID=2817775 RepID=UPI002856CA0A|nr:EAL domain-containing protein [Mycoplana sp. BE70]MDR6756153.1 diguanylate cyclase (GGDEF)-like protein/PAS domain S-box-containing protein [Mycoplana sp. BE70]